MTEVTLHGPIAGQTISDKVSLIVQTREEWSGSWEPNDFLEVLSASEAASPSPSNARFRWRYGEEIKREGGPTFGPVSPLSLLGHFIRIQNITSDDGSGVTLWTGVITEESFDIHGATDAAPQGDQYLTAFGLEHILDRITIIGAHVAKEDGCANNTLHDDGATVYIDWCPIFNDRYERGLWELGNKGAGNAFSDVGDPWTHLNICSYLLEHYGPPDVEFKLGGQKGTLGDIVTREHLEGLTLRQAFDILIPRSRGLGWCVRVDDDNGVEIHVHTLVGKSISVGDVSLPANKDKVSFEFDDARDILQAALRIDETIRVDRVVVQGARIRSMFSLSPLHGTLEEGWTLGEEEAYEAAANADDAMENDLERATDKYERVFSFFRVPRDWNWKTGENAENNANPAFDKDGKINAAETGAYWNGSKAFDRTLLLEKPAAIDNTEPEYMDPVAFVQVPRPVDDDGYAQDPLWAQADSIGAMTPAYDPYQLRMVDREMAVALRCSHANHRLAKGRWASDASSTKIAPQIDPSNIHVCVCCRLDSRILVEANIRKLDPGNDTVKTKLIEIMDAELWYITPGTAYEVSGGRLKTHAGGIERDDRDRLEAVAAFAKAWYGQERASVTLSLQKIYPGLRVGTYVEDASSSTQRNDVGTVVTMRSWDFQAMTTTIRTQYSEIDFAGML
jgi:hypothetical protein